MRDRLIELLNFVKCNAECCASLDGGRCGELDYLDRCQIEAIADHLLANNVIILPYNLHLPKELYRHMFDNDKNKVVVKCKVGKNTGYGFTLVHYRDGREWEYKYTSIGKTVFLSREEAEAKLKGE